MVGLGLVWQSWSGSFRSVMVLLVPASYGSLGASGLVAVMRG